MSGQGATRRERPADGGMPWHEKWNAFECYGCSEFEEIRNRALRTPAKLAELRELLIIEHTECWQFSDPQMAADARKFRKRKTLRENMRKRGSAGSFTQQQPTGEVQW